MFKIKKNKISYITKVLDKKATNVFFNTDFPDIEAKKYAFLIELDNFYRSFCSGDYKSTDYLNQRLHEIENSESDKSNMMISLQIGLTASFLTTILLELAEILLKPSQTETSNLALWQCSLLNSSILFVFVVVIAFLLIFILNKISKNSNSRSNYQKLDCKDYEINIINSIKLSREEEYCNNIKEYEVSIT